MARHVAAKPSGSRLGLLIITFQVNLPRPQNGPRIQRCGLMPVDTYASYVFVFLRDKSKKTEPTVTKFGARDDL